MTIRSTQENYTAFALLGHLLPSPVEILNLVEPIICNDTLFAVLALSHDQAFQSAYLLGVWTRHYACSRAS